MSPTKKPKKSAVTVRWSARTASLVEKGPEVSVVRWDHNKVEQAISNDQLDFGDQHE